jgi:chromosomal replication initiation ATPase DnaA
VHPELAKSIDRARIDRLIRSRDAEDTLHRVKLEHAKVVKALEEKISEQGLLIAALRAERDKRQQPTTPLHPKFEVIKRVVCERHKITNAELCSHKRTPGCVWARQLVYWLARDLTNLSTTQIAERLGNRDHTTVLHGVRQVARKMRLDRAVEEEALTLIALVEDRISQNAQTQPPSPGSAVSEPVAENRLEGARYAGGVVEGV